MADTAKHMSMCVFAFDCSKSDCFKIVVEETSPILEYYPQVYRCNIWHTSDTDPNDSKCSGQINPESCLSDGQSHPFEQDTLSILMTCFCCFSLPTVNNLNGSVVTDSEREGAERFFIRYYLKHPAEDQPYRYTNLIAISLRHSHASGEN